MSDEGPEPTPKHKKPQEHRTAKQTVEAWLEKSGMPLELRTQQALMAGGAHWAEHSRYYVDRNSGELRETDVVADFMSRDYGKGKAKVVIRLVVECKGKDVPWITFLRDDILARGTGSEQLPTFERVEWRGYDVETVTNLCDAPVLASVHPHVYNVQDTGQKQAAYWAVQQVMSAARGLKADVPTEHNRFGVCLLVPVIVTQSVLFTYRLDDDGEGQLEEVDRVLLVSRLVPDETLRSVWIVRDHAVEAFARDVLKSADGLTRANVQGDDTYVVEPLIEF